MCFFVYGPGLVINLYDISSLAINSLRKRELVSLLCVHAVMLMSVFSFSHTLGQHVVVAFLVIHIFSQHTSYSRVDISSHSGTGELESSSRKKNTA